MMLVYGGTPSATAIGTITTIFRSSSPAVVVAGSRVRGMSSTPKGTPLCNLYLTMLEQAGIHEERFGDSTGSCPDSPSPLN